MTLMQYIKLVLDDIYKLIDAPSDAEKDQQIKTELSLLASEYRNLNDSERTPIEYGNTVRRFAYTYKYTVAHADYVRQIMNKQPQIQGLFDKQNVQLTCLGGGPGSDLLGVLKFLLHKQIKCNSLTSYIFDKERAWGDSWSDVAMRLSTPFSLYPIFQQMDITDEKTWKDYQKFLNADLFTLSYFLSEVCVIKHQAQPFFDHCFSRMKRGAMLLFVDNGHSDFSSWFDRMVSDNHLAVLLSKTETLVAEHNEEKTDLEPYYSRFGSPKCQAAVSYRVVQKQ
jgi:hypothetical protein